MTLIKLPSSNTDITGIRKFIDECQTIMQCLTTFNQPAEYYSIATMDFYRKHLPPELLNDIAQQEHKKVSKLTLMHFIKALEDYCSLREDTYRYRENVGGTLGGPTTKFPTTTMSTQAAGNTTRFNPSYKQEDLKKPFNFRKCVYCNVEGLQGHMMKECPTVKNGDERIKILREKQRCTCCLSNRHNYRDCRSDKRCFCGGKHHDSIHEWIMSRRDSWKNQKQNRYQRNPPHNSNGQNGNNINHQEENPQGSLQGNGAGRA